MTAPALSETRILPRVRKPETPQLTPSQQITNLADYLRLERQFSGAGALDPVQQKARFRNRDRIESLSREITKKYTPKKLVDAIRSDPPSIRIRENNQSNDRHVSLTRTLHPGKLRELDPMPADRDVASRDVLLPGKNAEFEKVKKVMEDFSGYTTAVGALREYLLTPTIHDGFTKQDRKEWEKAVRGVMNHLDTVSGQTHQPGETSHNYTSEFKTFWFDKNKLRTGMETKVAQALAQLLESEYTSEGPEGARVIDQYIYPDAVKDTLQNVRKRYKTIAATPIEDLDVHQWRARQSDVLEIARITLKALVKNSPA